MPTTRAARAALAAEEDARAAKAAAAAAFRAQPSRYEREATLSGHQSYVYCAAPLADGRFISSSTVNALSELRVWDRRLGCVQTLTMGGFVWCVAALPNGYVACGGYDTSHQPPSPHGGFVTIFDISDGCRCVHTIGHAGSVECLAALPDSLCFVSGCNQGSIRKLDSTDGRCLTTIESDSEMLCLAVLQDGRVATAGDDDHVVKLFDLDAGRCVQTITTGHTDYVWCIALLPGLLVTGSADKTLKVFDLTNGSCLRTLTGFTDVVYCATVIAGGRVVAGGADDGTLQIYDPKTGCCLQTIAGSLGSIGCVTALPSGRLVVGASKELTIWCDYHREDEKRLASDIARQRLCGDIMKEISKFL